MISLLSCDILDDLANNDDQPTSEPTPTPFIQDAKKIVAYDPENGDCFGSSVSFSGDYAIVSAPFDDEAMYMAGSAYIFHKTENNTWDSGYKVYDPGSGEYDYFGSGVPGVDINGNYAIVGASNNAGTGAEGGRRGAAYIFHRIGENIWDAGYKITAPDGEDYDYFGSSVSISGDYAIIGVSENNSSGSYRGSVYIFHRTGENTWDAGNKIAAIDVVGDDRAMISVSISGDYAIVTTSGIWDDGSEEGITYIFHRTGINTWDTGYKITVFDGNGNDFFGVSVLISGDYAIVGVGNKKSAYIFYRTDTNTWDTGFKIIASEGQTNNGFGRSVSISGDYAVIGAMNDNNSIGAAYIFQRTDTNTWEERSKIIATDPEDLDMFGFSVAISGNQVIVGAKSEDGDGGNNTGAVYTYIW